MENNSALSFNQLFSIHSYVMEIIDNLDEDSISQLFSGNTDDIDNILSLLYTEVTNLLIYDEGKIKSGSFGYFDRFSSSVEETLRNLNLNYFIQSVLPEFEMNWHHIEWGSLVQFYNKLCIIAARDHGKSYFFSFAYSLWKLYRYRRPNNFVALPKEYTLSKLGMLITNEFGLSKHLLGLLKDEIESNDILREKLFPVGNKGWAETEITCKNGATLVAKSYGSKMRGFHPGWIICDDFLNDSVIYSEEQRNKYISFFHSVIMNMIIPGGQVINVGTPYSNKDLFSDLKGKPKWKVFEYPAIFPDGSLLWDNRHNMESLLDKKVTQGSLIFSREILVRPVSSDSTIFPWSILERSFIGMDEYTLVNNIWSHPKKFKKVAVGCDYAISANIGADFSVFTVWGVDDLDNYWLLYMYRKQGASYNEQIATMKKINQDFSPTVIMVETNQMQMIFSQGAREAGLPIVDHNTGTNKYDLKSGLPSIAILFEQNKIKLPRGDQNSRDLTDMMCMEFSTVTFTEKGKLESVSAHDDICMSTWIGIKACNYINQGFGYGFL